MIRKTLLVFFTITCLLFFTACGSSSDDSVHESSDTESEISNEIAMDMDESSREEGESEKVGVESDVDVTERMIIHQAQLYINVKSIEQAQANIEAKVNKYDGYIVESNIHRENENNINSFMVVRIPANHFQTFLSDTEEVASEVLERNVTGQDVTEDYVDLESRLKSKQTVEERLLMFMEEAEKTEDLLKISNDLATVQEDIEVIVGQMNYLENQTDFSTINISMYEDSVIVPELENQKLNTWEKTKKQLAISTNFLFSAVSAIVVFVVGNIPIIIILAIIGLVVSFMIRRKNKKE